MQSHKEQKTIAVIKNFISRALQTKTNQAFRFDLKLNYKSLSWKVICSGRGPFVCNVIVCEQYRQVNANTENW